MFDSPVSRQRLIGMLAVMHSIVVLLLWLVGVRIGLSGRVWVAITWLWLVWPVLLAILPGRSLRLFLVPVIISLVVLAVCIPAFLR